jgi:outer membrane lipoprotein-sorting protein
VQLEITPKHEICRIVIEQADGAVTEFRFTGQVEDAALSDERFRFSAPAGVEVITGDLGQ